MTKPENRAALITSLASTLLLAAVIVGIAAADPAGLFAIVSWTGSSPVAAWWWWAPYVVFLPLVLLLNFAGVRSVVLAMQFDTPRRWLFVRIWLMIILATAFAWFVNAMVVLYGGMAGKEYLLSVPATVTFLLWSGGYATLKIACLGWLPALIAIIGPYRQPAEEIGHNAHDGHNEHNSLAGFMAGLAMLLLALISPWIARHWWHGSPVGYIYLETPSLLIPASSPESAAGMFNACSALLICGAAAWYVARSSFARLSRQASKTAVFTLGAMSGVAAALTLFVVQTAWLCANGYVSTSGGDDWFIPAIQLLAVEACSYAVVAAACNGFAALLGLYLQNRTKHRSTHGSKRVGLATGALALFILAVMSYGTQNVIKEHEREAATPDVTGVLEAISVSHDADHAILANRRGSQVMLRGVNVNQLGEYYQADPRLAAVQTLTRQDFVDMAALGLNSVRLTLSWSRLEPLRGQISTQYLDAIRQAVSWAAEQHIYVILDMHQDAWSATVAAQTGLRCRAGTEPMKGWDGAPAWATLTDDAPACQFTGRDLAPNVSRAFQSFYFDRDGIQTALVHAWEVIAANFADNTTVIGYDLLNEPNFAETPPITSTLLLANYYARSIAAIRKIEHSTRHGYAHPIAIEPSIFWSGFGVDNLPPGGFLQDGQLLYSPHLYNESITSDQDLGINLVSIERGFRLAQHAASRLDAALWIGEWGFFGDARQQEKLWDRQANMEEQTQTGSAVWVWKQGCGDPHVYPGKVAGNIVRASCPDNQPEGMEPVAARILQRAYVRSAPGRLVRFSEKAGMVSFTAVTEVPASQFPICDLEVWIPGVRQPEVSMNQGVTQLSWQRLEPAPTLSGPSGGWILHGCVDALRYHVEIR